MKRAWSHKIDEPLIRIRKLERTNNTSPNESDTAHLRKLREELHNYLHPHLIIISNASI